MKILKVNQDTNIIELFRKDRLNCLKSRTEQEIEQVFTWIHKIKRRVNRCWTNIKIVKNLASLNYSYRPLKMAIS